ncbi:MAG: CHAD domain-containing protein [Pirellulaceae bacterium]
MIAVRIARIGKLLREVDNASLLSPNTIHDLRIATREADATLSVFQPLLKKKTFKRVRRVIKRIRQATGGLRDLDVLITRITHSRSKSPKLLKNLRMERTEIRHGIKNVLSTRYLQKKLMRWSRKGFRIHVDSELRFSDWAKQQLPRHVHDFLKIVSRQPTSPKELHQLRIAVKRLRYRLEILAEAFSSGTFKTSTDALKLLQKHLGDINDFSVAIKRFRKMRRNGIKIPAGAIRHEKMKRRKATREFREIWSLESLTQMLEMLEITATSA